jgi:protein TonB
MVIAVILVMGYSSAALPEQIYTDRNIPKDKQKGAQDNVLNMIPEEIPKPVSDIIPEYPFTLRSKGIKGTVVIRALVNQDGDAEQTEILEGQSELYEYALKAVKEAKFKPARQDGMPVKCWVHVPVVFAERQKAPDIKEGEVSFIRNDKVLEWRTANTGRFNLSDKHSFSLDSSLSSALNMATGSDQKDRWYDSVYNEAQFGYKISDKMGMEFTAREDWNRDTFSKFGKSLLTTTFDGNVAYKPVNGVDIDAGIGEIYDRRFENEDKGTSVHGKALFEIQPLRNLYTNLNVSGMTSNLRRSNDQSQLRTNVVYDNTLAQVSLGLEDKRGSRGYFSDIDRKGIEERERVEQNLSLNISRGNIYKNRNAAALKMFMDLGTKHVNDTANNNKDSSKYHNNSKGNVRNFGIQVARGFGQRFFADVSTDYARDENQVERRDRSRTQTDISTRGEIGIGFGRADSLTINGWVKRTRIDTPIEVVNDRDELKYEGGVKYTREIKNNFKTGLDFRVLETHYVNIDASQSSQNKWMKTYQLSPVFVYMPVRSVQFDHKVNLFVNYIDYDFDSDINPRSNITRRISSETWMVADISAQTKITTGIMFEGNDYGNLDSRERKLPLEEGIRRFGDISIDYILADWITLSPMYIYAIRQDTDINRDTVILREVDQTYGLKGKLFKAENGDYAVTINIKRIIRETNMYPTRIRDYITLIMRYEF